MQAKTILIAVLAGLLVIAGAFYWYEYENKQQIRKSCNEYSMLFSPQNIEMNYRSCLRSRGLEK